MFSYHEHKCTGNPVEAINKCALVTSASLCIHPVCDSSIRVGLRYEEYLWDGEAPKLHCHIGGRFAGRGIEDMASNWVYGCHLRTLCVPLVCRRLRLPEGRRFEELLIDLQGGVKRLAVESRLG